jgi:hypothetical protein
MTGNNKTYYIHKMAKKNRGASSSSSVKGKNGPSNVQNNKTEVGGKASSKDVKKGAEKNKKEKEEKNDNSHVTLLAHPIVTLKVLAILFGRLCKASANFVLSHLPLIIGICSLIAAF